MPPETPKRQRIRETVKSPYDSRSIIITVGREHQIFNILESFLKNKTSFFDYEGAPRDTNVDTEAGATDEDVTDTGETTPAAVNRDAGPKKTEVIPHYHLESKIHSPRAFQIFVDWLHNIFPSQPEDEVDCKALLQAYVLAVKYDAGQLQNAILKCFRLHHVNKVVKLHHLVWMVSNTGDNTELPLTAYLVEQIAYEIATDGIGEYEKSNDYLPHYMRAGNRFVRYELFKAIAWRATTWGRKSGDPATSDPDRWLVIVPYGRYLR